MDPPLIEPNSCDSELAIRLAASTAGDVALEVDGLAGVAGVASSDWIDGPAARFEISTRFFSVLDGSHWSGTRHSRYGASRTSAICTAFSAAPLRRLSPVIQRLIDPGSDPSSRTRPTSTGSMPAASSGVG